MRRKSKYSYEIKLQVVREYESGKYTLKNICNKLNITYKTAQDWWMIYQSQGEEGLKETHTHRKWDKNIKLAAVNDYLSGVGSLSDICKKYKISSKSILISWIKVYNDSHKELKTTNAGGNMLMTKGRKVTFDEKVEIVQYCIANSRNYYAAMEKYNISYQQIYSWIHKYDKGGIDALVDRRGKAKPESELTDMDRLRLENKMLEAKNIELEMEVRLLKKLQEIERRRR